MDVKNILSDQGSLQMVARKFTMKQEAGDHQLTMRQLRRLNKLCVKIGVSLSIISTFCFLRFLEAPLVGLGLKIWNIGKCAKDRSHTFSQDHQRKRTDSSREFLHRYADKSDNLLDLIVMADETWALHFMPETKHQSYAWQNSSSPKDAKIKNNTVCRQSWTLFWDRKEVLLVDFMAHGSTTNADRYCETLKKLRRAIQNRRRGMLTKGVCLLHDNVHPHVARQTVPLLDQFGWDIITHPPHSPDLVPCDYLFPKLKEHLAGRRFSDDDEVKVAVQRWYDMGIQKLLLHLKNASIEMAIM
jgi:histone-lysine N-methyltransferase SETMAR